VSDKVTVNFNVFRSFMKHRIVGNIYCSHIITFNGYRGDGSKSEFMEQSAEPS